MQRHVLARCRSERSRMPAHLPSPPDHRQGRAPRRECTLMTLPPHQLPRWGCFSNAHQVFPRPHAAGPCWAAGVQTGVHDSVSQSELWLPSRVNRPPAPSPATTSPATGHPRRPARPQAQPGEDVAARQGHHVGRVGACLQNLQSDWWLIQMAQGHHVSPAGSALA